MDGRERMEKEMVKVKSKPREPLEEVCPEKKTELADLFELGTGSLNGSIVRRYLDVHQFFTRNEKLQQLQNRYKSALASGLLEGREPKKRFPSCSTGVD